MKRILAIMLAAVMAFSMSAFAAAEETTAEAVPETQAAAGETEQEDTIGGFYIANYAKAEGKVDLTILSEPDLVWAAQQAGTRIYQFLEDGSLVIYENGGKVTGTYTVSEDQLQLEAGDIKEDYTYEFVDGLLMLRDGTESSLLYDFVLQDMDYITLEDYSTIEISSDKLTVTDEQVENYINTVLQGQTTFEEVTEGVTEEGDVVSISYEGVLEGEEEPFEGGSADGLLVQLGSGALIDDFEAQLTGQEIGSTLAVAVTFPEEDSNIPELAGKNAVFKTTINYKRISHTPELSDEWVKEYSAASLPEQLETVEEYREFCRNYLETFLLHTEMINALAQKTSITGYNAAAAQMLMNSLTASLAQNAQAYGVDQETFVKSYGYDTVNAYLENEATYDLNLSMIVNKVMKDLDLTYTAEELDESLNNYLRLSGYSAVYTLEEYKQQVGTAGLWTYTNLEFKLTKAMDALKDRVVITEPETEAETEAVTEAETEAETAQQD